MPTSLPGAPQLTLPAGRGGDAVDLAGVSVVEFSDGHITLGDQAL